MTQGPLAWGPSPGLVLAVVVLAVLTLLPSRALGELARHRALLARPRAALAGWAAVPVLWVACLVACGSAAGPAVGRRIGPDTWPAGTAWLVAAGMVAVLALAALARYVLDAVRARRHLARLSLVGAWDAGLGALVVPAAPPRAYTLAGWGRGTVVATTGCVDVLEPVEREAVLAHEQAHARRAHHLVRAWFAGCRVVLAGVTGVRVAEQAAELLLEVLADTAAAQDVTHGRVASALYRCCAHTPPAGGPWCPDPSTLARLRQLDVRGARVSSAKRRALAGSGDEQLSRAGVALSAISVTS